MLISVIFIGVTFTYDLVLNLIVQTVAFFSFSDEVFGAAFYAYDFGSLHSFAAVIIEGDVRKLVVSIDCCGGICRFSFISWRLGLL